MLLDLNVELTASSAALLFFRPASGSRGIASYPPIQLYVVRRVILNTSIYYRF